MITVLPLLFIFGFGRVTAIDSPNDCNIDESLEESEERLNTKDSTTTTNDGTITKIVYHDGDLLEVILEVEDESGTPYDALFSINDTCWQQENGRKILKVEIQHVNKTEYNLIFKLAINDCLLECKIPNIKNYTKLKCQIVVKSSPRLHSCFNRLYTTIEYSKENVRLPICSKPRQPKIINTLITYPPSIPSPQPNITNTTTSYPPSMPSPQPIAHRAAGTEGTVMLVVVWLVGIVVIVSTVVLTVVIVYLVWQRGGSGSPSRTRFDSQTVQPSTLAQRGSQHSSTNSLYESYRIVTNAK